MINEKKHSFEYYIFNIKKFTKIGIRIHPDPLHLAKVGSGSTFPGSGSVDPDLTPDQNEVDLQHSIFVL